MRNAATRRRLLAALVAVAVMAAAVLARHRDEPASHTFRVTLGLRDKEPTDWDGKLTVSGGEVPDLTGWRLEEKDAVAKDLTGWKCRTHEFIAPGERYPIQPASGKPTPPPQQPWPNGVTVRVRGSAPAVTLSLSQGEVKF